MTNPGCCRERSTAPPSTQLTWLTQRPFVNEETIRSGVDLSLRTEPYTPEL